MLLFTDGAYEQDTGASIGGVLYDPTDGKAQALGAVVSEETASRWKLRE